MINTKELMIGNWILVRQTYREVENIHDDYINLSYSCGDYEGGSGSDYYEELKDIEPIPLSEQILIDCGFIKHKAGIGGQDMWAGMDAYSYEDSGWLFRGTGSRLHLVGYFNTQIHYVHQLQNLFYLLTGKQLEIKL